VLLCKDPTPTPTIAYEILRSKVDGAINFTASHNPPEYNGLKFNDDKGAPAPPEVTHAENFYWVKQMQGHTPMAVVLEDGEVLRGTVEWYDRDCIKLTRQGSPNLLIFKRVIKYVYKDGEESANGGEE
jgi:phosphomannomutase